MIDKETIRYSLCEPFTYKNCFKSVEAGDVRPRYFLIEQPSSQLSLISVVMNRDTCDPSSAQIPLLPLFPDSNIYIITDSAMVALNYADSVLHQGDCLCGVVTLQSECDTAVGDLPNINLIGTGYCGDTITINLQNYFTPLWDSTSHCHDCFELYKNIIAGDTIHVGDTITFELLVHSNNGTQEVVYLTDLFPSGFVPLDTLPAYIITQPIGDTSIFVSGYYTQTSTCPGGENIGRLIFNEYDAFNQPNGFDTTYKSACQDVISKCITSSTIILADGDFASNGYLSSYVDTVLYVSGTFYVDLNMYFENCVIKTKAGSSIVLLGSNRLDFYNTTISGCDSMWRGIIVDYNGTVNLESGNSIQDANEGVNLGEKGNLSMVNSEIINSITGVRVPPQSSYFGGSVDFRQARFGMYAPAFLPDYVGQPAHGLIPYAGINVDDASLSIGDDSYGACTFHHMNIGIRGYTSDLEINNCVFDSIRATYFYNSKGNASAVVGIGDTANFIPSYIRVNPLPSPGITMDYCENGIYTFYSGLDVVATEMFHMRNGIDVHQCKDPLTSVIKANTIGASHYGVMMHDNHKGTGIYVLDNNIEIDGFKGGIGILAEEVVKNASIYYEINGNQIHLVNAAAGVQVNSVREASITYNTVDIDTGIGTAPINAGIQLNASDSCVVSCNHVSGYIDADVKCKGYLFSQSPRNTIQCNVADTVGYGFYFGGAACMASTFRGNFMGASYAGLYLNSEANIGQQPDGQTPPYHGNIWVDSARYISGYGAVNLNDTIPANLLLSLFTTNQGEPSHNPIIPDNAGDYPFYVNDNGWFDPQNDTITFNCDSSSVCPTYEFSGGGEEYRQMVAEDNAVSSVFIPESKVISQQLLYRELKEDSALLSTNVLYDDFVNVKEFESVGKLYEVEKEMKSVLVGDSLLSINLIASNTLLKVLGDSIRYIDSLILNAQSSLLQQQKDNIIDLVITSRSTLNTVGSLLKDNDNARITSALSKNTDVQPSQMPDANEKFINDVTFRYRTQGISVLLIEYEPVLQIAIQCPYSGGPAVYQARALIRLINDTIEYNDDDVCGILGIFRIQHIDKGNNPKGLKIIPNPSNGDLQVVFSGLTGNKFSLEIFDVFGRTVLNKSIAHVTNTCHLQLYDLKDGLYSLKLRDEMGSFLIGKLIITK